jgi:hypothetical protein
VALNRIALDLSQATPVQECQDAGCTTTTSIPAITAVQNPDTPQGWSGPAYNPNAVTSVTFNADFDADGCISGVPSQALIPVPTGGTNPCNPAVSNPSTPDTETICWGGSTNPYIYLVGGAVTNCPTTNPLLSGHVTGFKLSYRSDLYLYQNPSSGYTSWSDLDAAGPPVGNDNGLLDTPELQYVDSVVVQITTSQNGHTQTYETQVTLRNVQ